LLPESFSNRAVPFFFYFLRESLWKSTVPTLYVTELVVQLNCTHLLYLRTVPIFYIGRGNHSQIVQYLCSLYLQESLLICTVTSLFAVKFTVKSNRNVPFFFIGSRNHSQIVLYLSALYLTREALSNCIGNILHLPPPHPPTVRTSGAMEYTGIAVYNSVLYTDFLKYR
jgi:branched-subunit amino acid transport protein AzlD